MRYHIIAVSLVALALSGCEKAPAAEPAVSKADAQVAVEGMRRAWESGNAAKVDAIYAENAASFVPESKTQVLDSKGMHEANVAYADQKYDHVALNNVNYQLLGPDTFVASGTADFSASKGPGKSGSARFTEVFHKQADGDWKIVTEHISDAPKAV